MQVKVVALFSVTWCEGILLRGGLQTAQLHAGVSVYLSYIKVHVDTIHGKLLFNRQ